LDFTASGDPSDPGQANLRIEFVALDVNDDGDTTDEDEGFVMAYQSDNAGWVVADVPS
ncbi:MAG: hypothetical protein GWN07_07170, partial [Actinobacteria bacterium]|nr:hypothetical protein [Actinomycetota bacterium]NIU65255.1 hypothetical protein [Actinomycetota bacterium]NIW27068.1 hypothetical protein [Actinomycetota bacterium]NIX19617.1 hypothetical protein [Actinomycetota bacterium]